MFSSHIIQCDPKAMQIHCMRLVCLEFINKLINFFLNRVVDFLCVSTWLKTL